MDRVMRLPWGLQRRHTKEDRDTKGPLTEARSREIDPRRHACPLRLSSAAAREPQALSRCVEALGLALGALMQSAGEDVRAVDDG